MLTPVPTLRPSAPTRAPSIVVLGDLAMDVVLAPERPIEAGTDVSGRVSLRQGGSAATTARWAARLGARSMLICAVGRDTVGRSLVRALEEDGVNVRTIHVSGTPTARIGVVVSPSGERSFVADRAAALRLRPEDVSGRWLAGIDWLHLPAYSLLGEPIASAARQAIVLSGGGQLSGGRQRGISLDLASIGPLLAGGRRSARALVRSVAPDVLFATFAEARALIGSEDPERLLDLAPVAVVKAGAQGATTLARQSRSNLRFDFATPAVLAGDTTGAGDAFDAGFLVGWLASKAAGRSLTASLRQAALAGHRAAARQLTAPRAELRLG
jgi:sugar/nucleoside kinase (ribokinase family)